MACNQSCSCTCRGHQAGAGGSAVAVVDTLLPQRKEQSPVNPSGLWPWALLSFTGLSTDREHRAFSRHTGTTSLSLLSPPRPVSFSPSFILSYIPLSSSLSVTVGGETFVISPAPHISSPVFPLVQVPLTPPTAPPPPCWKWWLGFVFVRRLFTDTYGEMVCQIVFEATHHAVKRLKCLNKQVTRFDRFFLSLFLLKALCILQPSPIF